ncbi:metallophosphoesterase [Kocuria sp. M1N1S27]|uniref:metallophosphoesterase n=1 Tax=Kocuria kalidii TaxID=3376283 RepID=UPI0037ADFF46
MLKAVGAILGVLLLLLVTYGAAIEPRFILNKEDLQTRLPGLGQEWAGAEVAVFSDLQVGMWWDNDGMIERIVAETVAAEPEAVLLAGDYVYDDEHRLEEKVATVVELLEPLAETDIPVYAVMGNHDYEVGAVQELTAEFERMGFEVLSNEAAPIPSPGTGQGPGLHVVGIGPTQVGEADPAQALSGVPDDAPRLVLMHNPTTFEHLPADSAPMSVAGHTHCGQIAIPGLPSWSYLGLNDKEEIVARGLAPEEFGAPGNDMYVTCGVGFSIVPIRINAAPQLLMLQLQPA